MAMTTNNNVNEEVKNTQVEGQQQVENKPAEAPQPEEKKEGLGKKIWNKVKKPLLFVGIVAGAFGAGVAADHFVLGKNDSNQSEASDGCDQSAEE